jgi:hypothetical protein
MFEGGWYWVGYGRSLREYEVTNIDREKAILSTYLVNKQRHTVNRTFNIRAYDSEGHQQHCTH